MKEEKEEKIDIRGKFVAKTGEHVDYRIFTPEKKREEKTPQEYAKDEADAIFSAVIEGGKDVIRQKIFWIESELREQKAFTEIAKTQLESVLILCRRAMESGKLDKETYKAISIVVTNGGTDDYVPKNYKS